MPATTALALFMVFVALLVPTLLRLLPVISVLQIIADVRYRTLRIRSGSIWRS